MHVAIDDVIAEGDKVVQRTTAQGTMTGAMMGMPPSGKSATWQQIHILRFADGKQVEHWAVIDQLGMLQQLGFAAAPGDGDRAEVRPGRDRTLAELHGPSGGAPVSGHRLAEGA